MIAALIALLSRSSAAAGTGNDQPLDVHVNYVYAAQFGFGGYQVGGLRVGVYSLPLAYTLGDVYRDWDLRIGLPVVYGRYRFAGTIRDDGQRLSVSAQTNTIACAPALRLDIPLGHGVRVSPAVSWGAGSTFDSGGRVRGGDVSFKLNSSESAFYTYQAGATALYRRPWRQFAFFLGTGLVWAGDEFFDDDNGIESYATYRVGVEGRHPLGFDIAGRVPDGGLFFIYDHFFPGLEFTRVQRASLEVDNLFEIGITVGAATPLALPWVGDVLDDLQLGVSYQTGDGLDAWKLSTGFPF